MELMNIFWNEGLMYAKHKSLNSGSSANRKFRSFYGVSPNVCAILWNLLRNKPEGAEPKHLLWCLIFLKTYGTEHVNSALVGVDEKTFRLWVWNFIELLSQMNVVNIYNTYDLNVFAI